MKKGTDGDIINYIIGFNLAARRAELGVAIEQISKWSGIGVEKLTDFESGAGRPDASILVELAKYLDVSPPYFFSIPENMGLGARVLFEKLDSAEEDHDVSVSDGVAVIRAFARIKNQERRAIVLDIAQLMAKSESKK